MRHCIAIPNHYPKYYTKDGIFSPNSSQKQKKMRRKKKEGRKKKEKEKESWCLF